MDFIEIAKKLAVQFAQYDKEVNDWKHELKESRNSGDPETEIQYCITAFKKAQAKKDAVAESARLLEVPIDLWNDLSNDAILELDKE